MKYIAAAIIRENNKILICQRSAGGSTGYLWEFPGGKIEQGEDAAECVVRECKEELAVDIAVQGIFDKTQYTYPEGELQITFLDATIVKGNITLNVHLDFKWVDISSLEEYDFCPADKDVVKKLCMIG